MNTRLTLGDMVNLDVNIGGTSPTVNYDQYAIAGAAALSGTLNISLTNGFEPALSDSFEIMTFSSRSGSFDTVNGLSIGNGNQFVVDYQDNRVLLTVAVE